MSPDHPGRMNPPCGRFEQACPTTPCPGDSDLNVCDHWNRLTAWRAVSRADQVTRVETATRPLVDPRVRDAVVACGDRGAVLPISEQDDCGCRGRELTECRAGLGVPPGRVTLLECLDCQTSRLFGATNP